MKTLLISLIFISASVSAQEKEKTKPLPKIDTSKIYRYKYNDPKKIKEEEPYKSMDKMPVAKPKNQTAYSALKEPKKDTSKYKILNATPPKKLKSETKKQP
jgi:hypothetical protein